MIKIEHTDTYGFDHAIRGARNPMNSWAKSDSYWEYRDDVEYEDGEQYVNRIRMEYVIGPNDMKLLKNLATAGPDHGKALRMMVCYADVTGPLYWLKEVDTYRMGVEKNSCSTMHKIHSKEFSLDDFSHEHNLFTGVLKSVIEALNNARDNFLVTAEKIWWYTMIQLLPSSYNQRRTYMFSYAALRTMYHARKNHKLQEWHDFCAWIETLPYSELITDA